MTCSKSSWRFTSTTARREDRCSSFLRDAYYPSCNGWYTRALICKARYVERHTGFLHAGVFIRRPAVPFLTRLPFRQALADPIDWGALSAGARLLVPSTGTSAQQVDSVTDAPSLNRSVVLRSLRSVGRRGECGARGRCYRRKTLFLSCFPLCAALSVITDGENDRKRCTRRRGRQKTLHSGVWMTERAPAGCVDDMGSMPRRA